MLPIKPTMPMCTLFPETYPTLFPDTYPTLIPAVSNTQDGVAITHACVQLAAESAPGRKGDPAGLDQGPRTASTDAPQNSGTGKRCVVARTTNSD